MVVLQDRFGKATKPEVRSGADYLTILGAEDFEVPTILVDTNRLIRIILEHYDENGAFERKLKALEALKRKLDEVAPEEHAAIEAEIATQSDNIEQTIVYIALLLIAEEVKQDERVQRILDDTDRRFLPIGARRPIPIPQNDDVEEYEGVRRSTLNAVS